MHASEGGRLGAQAVNGARLFVEAGPVFRLGPSGWTVNQCGGTQNITRSIASVKADISRFAASDIVSRVVVAKKTHPPRPGGGRAGPSRAPGISGRRGQGEGVERWHR